MDDTTTTDAPAGYSGNLRASHGAMIVMGVEAVVVAAFLFLFRPTK